jgi:hypothetical protein
MRYKKWRVIIRNSLFTSLLIFASLIVSFLAKFIQQQDEGTSSTTGAIVAASGVNSTDAVTSLTADDIDASYYSKTVNVLYASSSALAGIRMHYALSIRMDYAL